MAVMKSLGLYIHIPFCLKKCNYCDFLSLGGMSEEDHAAYTEALLVELEHYADRNISLDSVYIGGGTPSLLDPGLISRVVQRVQSCFTISEEAEITIEANPGLLDKNKLTTYRGAGINRLSIGAQSLNNEILKLLGRVHDREEFVRNYHLARDCGFENISVDLIFAIPGQTHDIWMDSLEKTIDLGPEHISFYSLQIEEETPFYDLWKKGELKPVDDQGDRAMYHSAIDRLQSSGYRHYEISNAAKPGYESRHNLKYWSMDEYLGVGLGAHSYIDGRRFSNETDLSRYIRIAKEKNCAGRRQGASPWTIWFHENTVEGEMSEFMFTGLRKVEGIRLSDYEKRFALPVTAVYGDPINKHIETGLLEIDEKADRLRLTAKGMDLFNRVLVDFV